MRQKRLHIVIQWPVFTKSVHISLTFKSHILAFFLARVQVVWSHP
jgi:hypothetical protein